MMLSFVPFTHSNTPSLCPTLNHPFAKWMEGVLGLVSKLVRTNWKGKLCWSRGCIFKKIKLFLYFQERN